MEGVTELSCDGAGSVKMRVLQGWGSPRVEGHKALEDHSIGDYMGSLGQRAGEHRI